MNEPNLTGNKAIQMILLRRAGGFLVFSIAVQFLFRVVGVDILSDLNIFGEFNCWPWLLGALVIYLLLKWLTHKCGTARRKWSVAVASVTALLALGWLLPMYLSQDGLAIGILQFLNIYWILAVAVYWLGLHGVIAMMRSTDRRIAPNTES